MVYKFEAYDPDSNPKLSYFLLKNAPRTNNISKSLKSIALDEKNRLVDYEIVQVSQKI
jgi:hypothetical protein